MYIIPDSTFNAGGKVESVLKTIINNHIFINIYHIL